MSMSRFKEIFPSRWILVFFMVYVLLYICQGILIRMSKQATGDSYDYSTKSAVLLTEMIKLVIATLLYAKDHSLGRLFNELRANTSLLLLYLIPSVLYCIYNNLTYINLAYYDPTTYYILLQLRIAVTGIVYQILFKRYLNKIQWASLMLLTIGCIVKQLESVNWKNVTENVNFINGYLVLIFIQIFCSCFAGVYNEYLLKGEQQKEVHIMIQNVCMYVDSIGCNLFVILVRPESNIVSSIFDPNIFSNGLVVCILFNNALCGISTSYFIKTFNSIMKAYAAGIELLLTAVLCYFLFASSLNVFTFVSIAIVSIATYLYAKHPFITRPTVSSVA